MCRYLVILLILSNFTLAAREIKVTSYNAHNLFDTTHDEGKDDWEYLPKNYPGKEQECNKITNEYYKKLCLESDWTDQKLQLKLSQLALVIKNEAKPDILALSEVENSNVVAELAKYLGYSKIIVTNSPDKRGIDVALLFNTDSDIEFIESNEISVDGTKDLKEKPTRNILEVEFKIAGEPVSIFVNHWPSQGNPSANRIAAAKALKSAMKKNARKSKNHKMIAVGDFNTLDSDLPHPFKDVLYSNYQDPRETSKKPILNLATLNPFAKKIDIIDIHATFMADKNVGDELKKALPPGSYFYAKDMTWNLLDHIFISKNLLTEGKVKVDLKSYKIETPEFAKKDLLYSDPTHYLFGSIIKGAPFTSNANTMIQEEAGYSDHFPVSIKLNIE